MNRLHLIVYFLCSCICPAVNATDNIRISAFETEQLDGWKNKDFEGQTDYQVTRLDNATVLRAYSESGASGLFKEQRIDLQQTPYLNWSWRIENRLGKLNEQQKTGDDYAARIYIVIDGGWTFWNTKAINYVWTGNTEKGERWPNAFAGKNAMMVAVRSFQDPLNTWLTEKRNIQKDLKQIFNQDIRYIDAVALMTDTDNSKGTVTAYYSDIYFSKN